MDTVTGAIVLSSHTTGLGIIRALARCSIPIICVYYDKNDMGYVSKFVQRRIFCPHPEKHEKEFIELLVEYGDKYRNSVLFPADDETLVTVSKHKTELSGYYKIACVGWDKVRKIINKDETYALANSIGVPCPTTYVPKDIQEIHRISTELHYPCVVKPINSHVYYKALGKKLAIVDHFNQLVDEYNLAVRNCCSVMIQEYIPGADTNGYNYNSYVIKGEIVKDFTAQKVRLSPTGYGVPCVVVNKRVNCLRSRSQSILRSMGFEGYSCIEYKIDARNGIPKLMEINGRHNRSTLLSVECGVNFPWIDLCYRLNGRIVESTDRSRRVYWIDLTRDIYSLNKCRNGLRFGVFAPYLKRHIFAVLDLSDIRPIIKRGTHLVGKLLKGKSAKNEQ